MKKIYPSLIAADLLNLQQEIEKLEPHCAGFHVDIMDNHFVPNLTWGPMFANAISTITRKPLSVHFMVDDPDSLISRLTIKPHATIHIHIELEDKVLKTIKLIKEKGWVPGLVISPKTPVEKIKPFLSKDIGQVLIMSVEPGFSGQSFIPDVIEKIEPLIQYRTKMNLDFTLAMDGGIDKTNIDMLVTHGITTFSVGSGIFGNNDPVQALKELNLG